jgi:hypothetical protein
MPTARWAVMVDVVYVEPTDPVIELLRQARQLAGWHPKQGLDLVRGQLKSDLETGTRRIPKEVPPKTGVRQQATECPFHVPLSHGSFLHARTEPSVFLGPRRGSGAAPHVDV